MSKPRKDKVNTEPVQQGLQNPFSALQAEGLPAGNPATEKHPPKPAPPSKLGRVVLRREKAHRGGKTVVVIDDFATHLSYAYIDELSRRLRKAVGCGGTTKERVIEIQGEQVTRLRELLEAEGFRVDGVR